MRATQIFIAICILFVWTGVFADTDTKKLPLNGIVGLESVLEHSRQQFPGRIIKVELEDEDDAPSGFIYEVKILKSDGSVIEVEYDAKTLKVLEVEGDDWKNSKHPEK
jgi:uncharacterized membrane protein YkoI